MLVVSSLWRPQYAALCHSVMHYIYSCDWMPSSPVLSIHHNSISITRKNRAIINSTWLYVEPPFWGSRPILHSAVAPCWQVRWFTFFAFPHRQTNKPKDVLWESSSKHSQTSRLAARSHRRRLQNTQVDRGFSSISLQYISNSLPFTIDRTDQWYIKLWST